MPLLSVIIPCFQQAHFLRDAIDSVLSQHESDVEVVVVDDGSPDNTEAVVSAYPGVAYIREKRRGLAAARNAGYRASRGVFLVFLDADDRLVPGALAAGRSRLIAAEACGLVAGHFRVIGVDGSVAASPAQHARSSNAFLAMVADYFIGPPGVMMFRRTAIERVGGFDTAIERAADYEMALRVAREFPILVHDQVVLEYRRHGANMSEDAAGMLSATMRVLRRQRSFVRRTDEGRVAYDAGVRHWQTSWGQPLVTDLATAIEERDLRTSLRAAWVLLRYYPAGLAGAVAASRQRSIARRRAR